MNKFTKQNGITLIALIITIIVMLILVAVTINVALNGGLFDRAKEAVDGTQEQVEKEQLILAIVAANDALTGKINKGTLQNELNELIGDWQVTGEDGGPYGVTTPTGKVYTITKNGELAEGWIDNGDGTYTKGTETVTVGVTTYTNAQVQEKLGANGGTYTGTWTVIGVEGGKVKLVSTDNIGGGSVPFGYNDTRAIAAIKAEDESSPTDAEKLQRCIWSYNHLAETLDLTVQERTGIESARSITIEDIYDILGEENINKGTNYGKIYKYYLEDGKVYSKNFPAGTTDEEIESTWSSKSRSGGSYTTFTAPDGTVIDENHTSATSKQEYKYYTYTTTDSQKTALGSLATGYYLLASTYVHCYDGNASFGNYYIYSGDIYESCMFYANGGANKGSGGVRAVVSI